MVVLFPLPYRTFCSLAWMLFLAYEDVSTSIVYCEIAKGASTAGLTCVTVVSGLDELELELEEEGSMMTRTVVITLSAAAGYMGLVVGLMVWCRYRRRKRKQDYLNENPEGILCKLRLSVKGKILGRLRPCSGKG